MFRNTIWGFALLFTISCNGPIDEDLGSAARATTVVQKTKADSGAYMSFYDYLTNTDGYVEVYKGPDGAGIFFRTHRPILSSWQCVPMDPPPPPKEGEPPLPPLPDKCWYTLWVTINGAGPIPREDVRIQHDGAAVNTTLGADFPMTVCKRNEVNWTETCHSGSSGATIELNWWANAMYSRSVSGVTVEKYGDSYTMKRTGHYEDYDAVVEGTVLKTPASAMNNASGGVRIGHGMMTYETSYPEPPPPLR
jgi:hypothetical protein